MAADPVERYLLSDGEDSAWELYHENSKLSRFERHPTFGRHPSDATVVRVMRLLRRVRHYEDNAKVALPAPATSDAPLSRVVAERRSARAFGPGALALPELSALLLSAGAITEDNEGTIYPNPFRTVPSGGALYPLDLYVHARRVEGLEPGLYHVDTEDRQLDLLRRGDETEAMGRFVVQAELEAACAATVFVTAVFYRSTFKYGDRGYRFALLEAGHLAQTVCLTATALSLAATPVGGYFDRDADRHLGLDGLTQSTVYMLFLGRPDEREARPRPHGA
jgi:SagB-type dehydrogenase family enzyme